MMEAWEARVNGYSKENLLREDEVAEMALSTQRASEWKVVNKEVEKMKKRLGDEFT